VCGEAMGHANAEFAASRGIDRPSQRRSMFITGVITELKELNMAVVDEDVAEVPNAPNPRSQLAIKGRDRDGRSWKSKSSGRQGDVRPRESRSPAFLDMAEIFVQLLA